MALNHCHEERQKPKTSSIEQQGSYVYKVATRSTAEGKKDRKRRKVRDATEVENGCLPFAPLLAGQEDTAAVELRYRAFKALWSSREETIQTIMRDIHSEVLTNIAAFIEQASSHSCEGRVPTGVITLGSNISSVGNLFRRLQERAECNNQHQVIVLDSGSASNLKALLKTMIRAAITNSETGEEGRHLISDRVGPKLLPYDLELLHEHIQKTGSEKIVIAFKDTEAFDQRLLSDFISLISSWLDRVQFVLLFGVVTSMELFEGRLPRSTVNLLQGRHFEIQDSDNSVDQIFAALQSLGDGGPWLGHGVSELIVQNARDHFQSPERFKANVKYVLMTHFFANPLSIFLAQDVPVRVLEHAQLCETIRNLPSFRRHVDGVLEEGDTATARKLLDNDTYLANEAKRYVESGQRKMKSMFDAVECVMAIVKLLGNFKSTTYSDLAVLALRGQLLASKVVTDTKTAIKKAPSDLFRNLLEVLPETFTEAGEILRDLDSVLTKTKGSDPLRSQYDDRQTPHKTAVVGQRVKLTKGKAKLSKEESEYTTLVDRLDTAFAKYLSNRVITPEGLFMHEVFLSDHRTPTKEAFNPRIRFAIERGLSTPDDYLGSHSNDDANDDDDESAAKLSSSQPAISVLYQLYAESGAFVNIYDLWQAFYTIIGGVDGESCDERLALTMFYRSLSELKMMGMFKSTRKKPDHLAKSTWAGL